jgi:PAS domain S-box-containing protein
MSSNKDLDLEVLLNLEEGSNIYVLDQELRYVYYNKWHWHGMREAFDADVKIGDCKIDYLPDPLNTDFKNLYERAFNSESFKHVLNYKDEYFEYVFYPLSLDGKPHIMIKARTATEEIKVSLELERYREKLEYMVKDRTKEISNQRDYFQQLIDEDPSLIFIRDEEGIYRLVNLSMAQALGKPVMDVIGSKILEVIPNKETASKVYEEDLMILESGKPIDVIRRAYMKIDDSRWFYVKKKRINVDGNYLVMGVMSNVTDLIETRTQLEQTNKELNRTIDDLKEMQLKLVTTEKIASILLLTSGFMHEINNPINYVAGNVQPLRNDIDDLIKWIEASGYLRSQPDVQPDFDLVKEEINILLEGIEEGTHRVKKLVNNLKKLSYSHTEEELNCDFHEVLDGVITMLSLLFEEKRIKVNKQFESKRSYIFTNPNHLNQVFINILDYTVSRMENEEELIIKTSDKGEDVSIEIKDCKRGIPSQEISRMLEPFTHIEEDTKVDLAVSYRIVTKMRGTITTKNERSNTHFLITIPVYIEDSPA